MNLRSGDVLVGDVPVSIWKHPIVWLAQTVIQRWQKWTGYKEWWPTHVKLVVKPLPADGWLIFEFTTPVAKFSVIEEMPAGYVARRYWDTGTIRSNELEQACMAYEGSPYDGLELLGFLGNSKNLELSKNWFVCSTGINEIFKLCGKNLWPKHKWICPATFADYFEKVENNA